MSILIHLMTVQNTKVEYEPSDKISKISDDHGYNPDMNFRFIDREDSTHTRIEVTPAQKDSKLGDVLTDGHTYEFYLV